METIREGVYYVGPGMHSCNSSSEEAKGNHSKSEASWTAKHGPASKIQNKSKAHSTLKRIKAKDLKLEIVLFKDSYPLTSTQTVCGMCTSIHTSMQKH